MVYQKLVCSLFFFFLLLWQNNQFSVFL